MSDDFENIGLGKQKLEENDIDGAMHHLFKVLKDNKDHIELYLINFDLFCRIQISTKNYDFLKTIAEYYFRDNCVVLVSKRWRGQHTRIRKFVR